MKKKDDKAEELFAQKTEMEKNPNAVQDQPRGYQSHGGRSLRGYRGQRSGQVKSRKSKISKEELDEELDLYMTKKN